MRVRSWPWRSAPTAAAVATGSADDTAQLWDAATSQPIGEPLLHGRQIRAVAIRPDGKVVATGDDRAALLWDAATGLGETASRSWSSGLCHRVPSR